MHEIEMIEELLKLGLEPTTNIPQVILTFMSSNLHIITYWRPNMKKMRDIDLATQNHSN